MFGTFGVIGYLLFFFWSGPAVPGVRGSYRSVMRGTACCALPAGSHRRWRSQSLKTLSGRPRRALAIFLFVVLPIWGLVLNAQMADRCDRECPADPYRVLAAPEIYGLLVLRAVTAGGYAISRRRAEDLATRVEPWVVALLLIGLLLHLALAIQVADLFVWLALFPATLPLVTRSR